MANKKHLIASIIQFLSDEQQLDELTPDAKESLEVAIQCLQSAYDVNAVDASLLPSRKLIDIFKDANKDNQTTNQTRKPVSEEAKAEAERLKNQGNDLMKSEQFSAALHRYTKAIELDGENAVYYCNRAAAHSKLNNHQQALEDCKKAIGFDPNYSKAYGRMGLAYASLNDHFRARDCYKKAVELDPQNESYRNNLRIAEEKLNEMGQNPFGNMPNPFGNMNMPFDIGSLLTNPAIMNFASQMMNDPSMQNFFGGISNQFPGSNPNANANANVNVNTSEPDSTSGSGAPGSNSSGTSGPPGIENLLQLGQQFAAQLQAQNPQLIEQLRSAMGGGGQPQGDEQSSDQPEGQDKKSN